MSKSGAQLSKSFLTGMVPPKGPQVTQHGTYQALLGTAVDRTTSIPTFKSGTNSCDVHFKVQCTPWM